MPKTYLVLDGKLIKLKPNTNPALYRAIYKSTRTLQKELQHVIKKNEAGIVQPPTPNCTIPDLTIPCRTLLDLTTPHPHHKG